MRKKLLFSSSIILIFLFSVTAVFAQMFGQEPTERTRTFDVQHITISAALDLKNKTVEGWTLTKLVPLSDGFTQVEFDAIGMEIKSAAKVMAGDEMKKDLIFSYDKQKLTITLDKSYLTKDTLLISVSYKTTDPEKGLYFISPTETFPNKPYQVWSQGEGEDNRYWFPCYDYPNDMASTEIYVTADKSYQTLSNGVLKTKLDNGDGTNTWHWVNELPHVSYLVMLGVGNWDVIEENWSGIPIYSYVPVGKKEWGERSYRQTADILKFFSEKIGFKYPWGKFSQVAVEDYIYGGMENTGAVVLFDGSVYDDKTEPDYNAVGLVAHELAHQWWGDAVTCKNWNEIWLNESFATYFQCLYFEHHYGKDEFDYNIFRNTNDAIRVDSTSSRKPIYVRDGLTTNTYDKGSVVLNMLRYMVGDEKFWKAMNIYITKNKHTPVVTKNLVDAVHEAAFNPELDYNRDYTWFFEEWIYKAGQPEYEVSYVYDESQKRLQIISRQVQRLDSSSVFKTPVPVEIITAGKTEQVTAIPTTEASSVYVNLDSKPLCVIFNKGNKVLSKLYFTKPKSDWLYQLKNSPNAIDRITAVRGLKDFINDDEAVNELVEVMKNDKFWGVRYEAAVILSNSTNSKAQEGYIKNLVEEKDSRVRRAYITGIGTMFEKNPPTGGSNGIIEAFMVNLIENETSYYAVADGITTLNKIMGKDRIYDVVFPYVSRDSHAEIIRRHVMGALDSSNDPRALDILLEYSEKGSTARLRNIAINGLKDYLDNPGVIDFLNKKVLEKTRSTQGVILGLLEKAKNPSSRPYLEQLLAKTNDDGFKKRVSETLQKLD